MNRRESGIVAATFLAQAVAIGSTIGAYSLFVRPVVEEFGASMLAGSAGISLITMMLGVSGVPVGLWLDRGSPRRVMLTGVSILVAGLLLASQATALWQLGLACVFTGCGIPMLVPLTTAAVVGKTFDATRGRALGIANTGINIGGLVFALVAGFAIESWGWRAALQVFAVLAFVLAAPAIAL
jgi:MFS family permease